MKGLIFSFVLGAASLLPQFGFAQEEALTPYTVEQEKLYTESIERRTADIMKALDISDGSKSNAVHNIIVAQYRLMRSRDAFFDAKLEALGKEDTYANRANMLLVDFKPVHEYFFRRLSKPLTPEQIEKVKDKMTYDKVKVTYDAYVAIVPKLTDEDKAKILELLKAAREEAVDGGSSHEKSEIFQKYKLQINDYLNAHGHDVTKSYKDWESAHPGSTNAANPTSASAK